MRLSVKFIATQARKLRHKIDLPGHTRDLPGHKTRTTCSKKTLKNQPSNIRLWHETADVRSTSTLVYQHLSIDIVEMTMLTSCSTVNQTADWNNVHIQRLSHYDQLHAQFYKSVSGVRWTMASKKQFPPQTVSTNWKLLELEMFDVVTRSCCTGFNTPHVLGVCHFINRRWCVDRRCTAGGWNTRRDRSSDGIFRAR